MDGRFDPTPDKPYAVCTTEGCGLEFADREAMHAHLHEMQGHRASVTNPTRIERIGRDLEWEIESLMDDFIEVCWKLVDSHEATKAEIREALTTRGNVDLLDAWNRSLAESGDDEDEEEDD